MFKTANRDQLVRNEEISAMKRELCMYISDGSDFQFLQNTHGDGAKEIKGACITPSP